MSEGKLGAGSPAVADVFGELILDVNDAETGIEPGSITLEAYGPHFVLLRQFPLESGEFALETSRNLTFVAAIEQPRSEAASFRDRAALGKSLRPVGGRSFPPRGLSLPGRSHHLRPQRN